LLKILSERLEVKDTTGLDDRISQI